ncbi:HypC/HybG/HupF family hydrogenase formation chaperone [Exilibacterium tricleocarpae]|uniref:HypC/HybG/HupF family hydrogenase formation chaperone n=1 Tax=Exilibacterium tricleocarpae TaxID=2591008 RepID=A0A545TFF7_9GAMM|nr:HypC/HybG/HupF family hydrogenase formation chaperone [Exilibacterium tricleocarpae]TQV75967.1 HypC/HybG/HupF family hydrogenase formation chaperone [Exilibacterium tricleocarpae]
MCIGTPMQVVSCAAQTALCELDGSREQVDITLVGAQPAGTWLLVFLGAAREVMDPLEARRTLDGIAALQQVMRGSAQVDHLFADLVDREPPLPEHLRPAAAGAAVTVNNGGARGDDITTG